MNNGLKFYQYEEWIKKQFPEDYDKIDSKALFDNTLSLEENKTQFGKMFTTDIEPAFVEAQQKEHFDEFVNEKRKESMFVNLDGYYKSVYQAIEKLKMDFKINLVLIRGRAGIGKTVAISNALRKFGMDYTVVNNITDAYLFRCLFENNEKVIWLKDCANLFRSKTALEMMKAATETEKEFRLITRMNYSKDQTDLPREFMFTGKIILDYNSMVNLKYSEDFNALVSRGDYIELVFSKDQMGDIMNKIANEKWKKAVTKYLIGNFDFTQRFNLRHQQKAFMDYKYAKEKKWEWKKYLSEQMNRNKSPVRSFLYQFIGDDIVKKSYLVKCLLRNQLVNTPKTAYRRITNWIETEELFEMQGQLSLNPF